MATKMQPILMARQSLTNAQKLYIWCVYTGKQGQATELAERFEVTRQTIWRITSGNDYRFMLWVKQRSMGELPRINSYLKRHKRELA